MDRLHLGIGFQKMLADDKAERLGFRAKFFLRQNVHRVLHGVGRNHQAVVGFGVGSVEVALAA